MPNDNVAGADFSDNPGQNGGSDGQDHNNIGTSGGAGNDGGSFDMSAVAENLSAENRQYLEKKNWQSLDAVMDSYRNLERRMSSGNKTQDSSRSQSGEYTEVKSPADYKFTRPESFPENAPYDDQMAEAFKTWAYEAKLDPKTASSLHDQYATHLANAFASNAEQRQQSIEQSIDTAHSEMVKAFGNPETPGFQRSVEMARRAMSNLDPDFKSALVQSGLLVEMDGQSVATNAAVIKALAKVGGQMYAEDSLFGSKQTTENPFDKANPNFEQQGKLLQENPDLAWTLITAAGVESDWAWRFKK